MGSSFTAHSLSVVLPAYNEEQVIASTVEQVSRELANLTRVYWLLGSCVQKQALRDGERSSFLLANTGEGVYNPKSSPADSCSNDDTLT
jgi:hypothetical protein